MSLPQHKNPTTPNRTASAPYNFVPLPERVVKAVDQADDLPSHDVYQDKSGYFDVTLTTQSPLYVRCPFLLKDFLRQEREEDEECPFRQKVKNTPHFFYTHDKTQPVIPGSSLRGMLRSLLEIVSYGKVERVTDKRLFFRTVDGSAIGTYYNKRMVKQLGEVAVTPNPKASSYRSRVQGGFLRIRSDGSYEIEECIVARIETDDLLAAFCLADRRELYELGGRPLTAHDDRNPNQTPKWAYQHRDIWVDVDASEGDYFFPKQFRTDRQGKKRLRHPDLYLRFRRATNPSFVKGKKKGKIVLTGHMNDKHLAFVFLENNSPAPNVVKIPNERDEPDINRRLVDLFHGDDQITRWQASAFPHGQPGGAQRNRNGYLRDGKPVFFLMENNELVFFGRAQMFRLPYRQRPVDLIPKELRRPEDIDYADALFGFVRSREDLGDMKKRNVTIPQQGEKGRAYASRVFVTDAHLTQDQDRNDLWLSPTAITPRILATPKPTSFQHYLTQQNPNSRNDLNHYDSSSTVLRGHKRYWHQGDRKVCDIKETGEVGDNSTQHTQFKPVKTGVKFSFRVYFENLSERELGAICWVLHPLGDPEKTYCHSLGMGKPLGMGAVKLDATLHLIDCPSRYGALFNGDNCDDWQTGTAEGQQLSDRATLKSLTQAFERHILNELQPSPTCNHLSDLKRIGMLLKMMECPGFPPDPAGNRYLAGNHRPNTRYMSIHPTNEYRDRPVLPDPSAFGNLTGKQVPTVTDVQATEAEEGPSGPTGDGHGGPGSEPHPDPSLQKLKFPAPAPKPKPAKSPKQGDRVWAEIVAINGTSVTVRVLDNQDEELRFQQPYYRGQPGTRQRMRVMRVDTQGRITQVTP